MNENNLPGYRARIVYGEPVELYIYATYDEPVLGDMSQRTFIRFKMNNDFIPLRVEVDAFELLGRLRQPLAGTDDFTLLSGDPDNVNLPENQKVVNGYYLSMFPGGVDLSGLSFGPGVYYATWPENLDTVLPAPGAFLVDVKFKMYVLEKM